MTQKTSSSSSNSTGTKPFLIILLVLILGLLYLFATGSSSSSPSSSSSSSLRNTNRQQGEDYHQHSIGKAESFHLSGHHNLSSYVSSPLLEPKCLTYKERYRLCMDVRTKLKSAAEKRFFFSQFLRTDSIHPLPKEVALYRLHRTKSWSEDFWLNVCSWITETTGLPIIPVDEMMATQNDPDRRRELYEIKYPAYKKKVRDTWLFTLGGHEDSIPNEFGDFIKIHLEDELPRIFSKPLYYGGYTHGADLAAGLFLKVNPQYDFCWIFESDTRFGGTSWHRFLTMARVAGKLNIDHTPIAPNNGRDGIGKEAHLIWFYPRLTHHGYGVPTIYSGVKNMDNPERRSAPTPEYRKFEREYWNDAIEQRPMPADPTKIINKHLLNFRTNYFGTWRTSLENVTFNAAFIPACGFSSRLAKKVLETGMKYDGHMNQELMTPIVAQMEGLKMTSLVGLTIPKQFSASHDAEKYFPFQFYFGFTNRQDTAPMYPLWMNGERMSEQAAQHQSVKAHHFANSACLEDILMHPVKF